MERVQTAPAPGTAAPGAEGQQRRGAARTRGARALTSASRKAPNDREIAVRRGELLSQAGRLDEASSVLNAVLKHRFHPAAAAELGFVKLRQNQSADAMRLLRAALAR